MALVIPLYNEEEVFPLLFEEIESYRAEHPEVQQVIFVDDGSRDRTARLVRDHTEGRPGYLLISFSRNFGHELAVTAGLDFAETEAAVIVDADLQDPLHVVTRMIEKWREGYDVVYGIRKERKGETLFKKWTARIFHRFFNWMADLDLPNDTGDFRLLSRRAIDAFKRFEENRPWVRGLTSWVGFNQAGIEYVREPRAAGETSYPLRKLLNVAIDSITSFSEKPLHIAIQVGLFVAGISMVGVVWALVGKFVLGVAVSGWTSLIISIFLLGGVQLSFMGLLGIYVARIYEDVRNRPRYIVQETWRSETVEEKQTVEAQRSSGS